MSECHCCGCKPQTTPCDVASDLRAQLAAVEGELTGARKALGAWSKHEIGQTLAGGINNLRQAEMVAKDLAHSRITKCTRCDELTAERDRNREDAIYYLSLVEKRNRQVAAAEQRVAVLEGALRGLIHLIDDGLLNRSTTNDAHFPSFLVESLRLVKVIGAAQAALRPPPGWR